MNPFDCYCKIFGEFYYCGLSVHGELIMSEDALNKIISKLNIFISAIENKTLFVELPDKNEIEKLHKIKLRAECHGDEEIDSDIDENYIFTLIEK